MVCVDILFYCLQAGLLVVQATNQLHRVIGKNNACVITVDVLLFSLSGDGSKKFILMVSAALREVLAFCIGFSH